eukprot:jgi/Psemu1/251336/estExt_Genewise1Plus.C_280066
MLAAIFFVIGNSLTITYYVKEYQRNHFDYYKYVALDPGYIQVEWGFRILNRPLYLSAGILNVIAWFFLMFPIVHLSWILSQGGTKWIGLHIAIGVLILTGSLTEWISHVLYIGASMTSQLMAREFNLDNWITSSSEDEIGWRTLEMTHVVTYGFISAIGAIEWLILSFVMELFCYDFFQNPINYVLNQSSILEVLFLAAKGLVWIVNAAEWFCLAGVFILSFFSVLKWRKHDESTFGAKWNALGLFIGLVSAVDFIAEIIGVEGYKIAWIFVVLYSSLTKLILIPLWIIILGFQLPLATSKAFDSGVGEVEMAEEPQDGQDQRPAPFTIDEDDDVGEGEGDDPNGPTSPPPEAFSSTNPTATS